MRVKLPFNKDAGEKERGAGNGRREGSRKQAAQPDWRSDALPRRSVALRAVVVAVVLALLALPPVFVSDAIGYVPLVAAVLAIALSYAYLRVVAGQIEYGGISSKGSCPRNTDATYLVRFKNSAVLPATRVDAVFRVSSSYGADDVLKRFSLSLGPRQSKDFEYAIRFAHVGQVEIGISQVVVHCPLGLFQRRLQAEPPAVIDVTPRIFPVDDSITRSLEFNESKESMTPFNKEGMDYMGVREYQLGDPMKTIHWKLSSRMDDVMYTRLFETSGNPGIDLLCDLHAVNGSSEALMFVYDAIMELALSLHRFGVTRSLRMDLLFYDRSGELMRFTEHHDIDHHELLRRMPLPGPKHDAAEIPLLVQRLTTDTSSSGNMIVLTSCITARLAAALGEAREQGKRVALFLVVPEVLDAEERQTAVEPLRTLHDEGVQCAAFSSADDLKEITFG